MHFLRGGLWHCSIGQGFLTFKGGCSLHEIRPHLEGILCECTWPWPSGGFRATFGWDIKTDSKSQLAGAIEQCMCTTSRIMNCDMGWFYVGPFHRNDWRIAIEQCRKQFVCQVILFPVDKKETLWASSANMFFVMCGWPGTLHTRVRSYTFWTDARCYFHIWSSSVHFHRRFCNPSATRALALANAVGEHVPYLIQFTPCLEAFDTAQLSTVSMKTTTLWLCTYLSLLVCFHTASTIQKQKPSQTSSSKGKLRKVTKTMNTVTPLVGAHKILFASAFAPNSEVTCHCLVFGCFAPLSRLLASHQLSRTCAPYMFTFAEVS